MAGDAEIEAPADETVVIEDLKLGEGEAADSGDTVNVGVSYTMHHTPRATHHRPPPPPLTF